MVMIETTAFSLIQQYINGWKENNLSMITSCLTENCIVIESHGSTYYGITNIKKWFELWLDAKSRVTKWHILSFCFCEKEKSGFVEWDFSCISNNSEYSFQGISVVKFHEQKISFLQEYRMTHQAYEWKGDKLESE